LAAATLSGMDMKFNPQLFVVCFQLLALGLQLMNLSFPFPLLSTT